MPKLTITQGPGSGTEYDIERAAILGRLDTNDIPVLDKKASREHAKIYKQGQTFAIVDLNSSNGTFVNGEQITKRVLKPGDEITIGVVHMRFEDDEAAQRAKAGSQRKSLDEVLSDSARDKTKPQSPAAGATADSIQLTSHEPLQYSRIRGGKSDVGFDFDQLSPAARFIGGLLLIGVFAGLIYLGYVLMAG